MIRDKRFVAGVAVGVAGTLLVIAITKVLLPLLVVLAVGVVAYLLVRRRDDAPSA